MTTDRPVIWISHRDGEHCAGCAQEISRHDLVQVTRETGIRCARCAGFGDLVFLPAGNDALTRRALAQSARSAVVVTLSRARGRNERRVLVEPEALERAQGECAADAARRASAQARRRPALERAELADRQRFEGRGVPPPA